MQGLDAVDDLRARGRSSRPITEWTLTLLDPPVEGAPALDPLAVTVPCSVHSALVTAGRLRDIAVDGTEDEGRWISRARWRYATRVEAPEREAARAVLEFGGIDTVATVRVNGVQRLATRNMHRRWEVDVTDEVRAGGGLDLEVDLEPALAPAQEAERVNPLPRPDIYGLPYNQVRKMACSFGWDWGPTTVTAGLWRPVVLHTWDGARLADVRVSATLSPEGLPRLEVDALTEAVAEGDAERVAVRLTPVTGEADAGWGAGAPPAVMAEQGAQVRSGRAAVTLDVPAAQPWYPIGYGDQPLYDVVVELLDAAGSVVDRQERRVGFRTVELVQTPDAAGSSCELHVNGRRIWVRGLNWIPDDCFPERVDAARLRTRIGQAVDTGANLLRVWGGGTFESDDFYDTCDASGVLVWQDFLFACAAYPEDDATVAEIRAEAADNVRRLRHRASLAVWCGCNENLWGYEDWAWKDALDGRPWGSLYYYTVLPELVAEHDGTRPYVPGSPFSPDDRHPNDDGAGSTHIWDVWNDVDYDVYEQRRPRFAAEFGWQAPASWPTLARAIGSTDLQADDPRLQVHQKAGDGTAKLRLAIERHYRTAPVDGRAWYYATQVTQARAVRTGISHLRGLHEHCSGTVWWQHNDCWPAISWSIVDVAGRRKLAWYAMRQVYAARLPVLTGDHGSAGLVLVNDTGSDWTARVPVSAWTADGQARGSAEIELTVPAHGSATASVVDALGGIDDDAHVLVADAGGTRATRWLRPDLELPAVHPSFDVDVIALPVDDPQEVLVQVHARSLVRDLCLLAEIEVADAEVDQQLLTLLPGEIGTFRVGGSAVAAVPGNRWAELLWSDDRLR